MEDVMGAMSYSSLDEMCSEEADFMAQLLVSCNSIPINNVECESSSTLWHHGDQILYGSSAINHVFPFPNDGGISNYMNDHLMAMDYCTSGHVMGSGDDDDNDDAVNLHMSEDSMPEDAFIRVESKKRSRVPGDIPVPRSRRGGAKLSKRPKVDVDDDDHSRRHMMNSSSSCCSADSMNNSSCSRAGATPKTRAGRGSATDPQSLYARKRRERINERLKVLQKLVPNGTKVDISTMLEEAVQYVKFLQLQIKLLSSDDMWMYAPIAYNGMDINAALN